MKPLEAVGKRAIAKTSIYNDIDGNFVRAMSSLQYFAEWEYKN